MTPVPSTPTFPTRSVLIVAAGYLVMVACGTAATASWLAPGRWMEAAALWAVFAAAPAIVLVMLLLHRHTRESLVARAAVRIASGDARQRVSFSGNGQLSVVADSINSLANRLAAQDARLAATRNELQAILQSMDGGVIVLDLQQRVLSLNRAAEWMLGLTDSQVRGRLLQEVARQPELNRFVAEALNSSGQESEFALQGQPARRVRATNSLLADAEGKQVGVLVVLSDITQLRRLESVRSDFASNVSHELRTPITNIKGYVETLLDIDVASDRDQTQRFLKIIAKNADRLGAIVEDMLVLTQLERPDAKVTLSTERTRVHLIAESVQGAMEPEADAKAITVVNETDADLWAEVNPQLIEQALSNLVINAIRYCPRGTKVWIRSASGSGKLARDHVEISVEDEGPGIAEEHLLRIFERFYRIDKARSREQGGTGLGLAIVKHIIQLHGGRVEVDSAMGKGSTFRLILPAG